MGMEDMRGIKMKIKLGELVKLPEIEKSDWFEDGYSPGVGYAIPNNDEAIRNNIICQISNIEVEVDKNGLGDLIEGWFIHPSDCAQVDRLVNYVADNIKSIIKVVE